MRPTRQEKSRHEKTKKERKYDTIQYNTVLYKCGGLHERCDLHKCIPHINNVTHMENVTRVK